MKVYIGYDVRDDLAYRVAEKSLLAHTTIPVEVVKLCDYDVRKTGMYRRTYHTQHDPVTNTLQKIDDIDGKPFSTDFSFLRFAVPALEHYRDDWVLFTDPDILWRADIAELLAEIDRSKAVCCVKHEHAPNETHKMDGVVQTLYHRKNWSSVMAINPSRCRYMNRTALNTSTGAWLHALTWARDEDIGALSERWNWLCGHSHTTIDPALVHFTRGTPDMAGHENEPYADEWRAVLNARQAVRAA